MHLYLIPLLGLLLFTISWTILSAWGLFRNYQKARQFGLPVIISVANVQNPVVALSGPGVFAFLGRLPFGIGSYFKYVSVDWVCNGKYETHEKLGNAIIIIDPKMAEDIHSERSSIDHLMNRRKDFTKPEVC